MLKNTPKRKSSTPGYESGDDDRALLLPSQKSSFNLTGDSELLLKKSGSHHSSGNSYASSSSRKHRHSSGAGGCGATSTAGGGASKDQRKSKRQLQQHPQQHRDLVSLNYLTQASSSASLVSVRSSSSMGTASGNGADGSPSNSQNYTKLYQKQNSMPLATATITSNSVTSGISPRPCMDPLIDSDYRFIHPSFTEEEDITKSGSLRSIPKNVGSATTPTGNKNYYPTSSSSGATVPESNESIQSNNNSLRSNRSINTIHSGKSYKSQKSSIADNASNKSKRSSIRRRKSLRKQERRQEEERRRRRQRFMVGFIFSCGLSGFVEVATSFFLFACVVNMSEFGDVSYWFVSYWMEVKKRSCARFLVSTLMLMLHMLN